MKKIFYYDTYAGRIGIAEEDGAITELIFSERDWPVEETELIKETKRQLDEYFEGRRKTFDIPTKLVGTEFQKKVWNALADIPYGETATYKDIAEKIGCPKGFRAVGLANNRNPISIIYPCHRVIGTNGSLTGYGGGLDVKEKLLALEKKYSSSYAVGVDVGGTEIKIGLLNSDGKMLDKTSIPTRHEDNSAHILEDAAGSIEKLLERNNISVNSLTGIGIGIPGPVADGIVKHCVNLHWENSVDAAGEMEVLTGVKTVVLNDANAAALGEQWMGGGKGHDSMVLVTLGTGIGGGIIINGNVLTGANGAGGEIGHITAEFENGRSCNCGRKGCIETYASATGIVRTANELLAKTDRKSLLREEKVTAKSIFEAEAKGDWAACETVDIFGKYLGRTLADIAAVVDPEIIVLAGGVVKAGEVVSKTVGKYFRKNAFKTVKDTEIVLAKLENDAGMYGAARYAFISAE